MEFFKAFFVSILCFWQVWATASPEFDPKSFQFRTGQVIAISEMNADPTTIFFEAGTGSRFGHIGIVAQEGGKVFVYEANPPQVQKVPISDFIDRSRVGRKPMVAVVDLVDPLSQKEAADLIKHMNQEVKGETPYNFSMVMNETSVNCSEFVMKAFAAIGRKGLGDIETVSDMNLESMGGALASLWQMFGPLPAPSEKVVSPVSIVNSPQVKVLASNLPVGVLSSDFEILTAWIKDGGMAKLALLFRNEGLVEQANMLLKVASKEAYRTYPKKWRQEQTGGRANCERVTRH